ncbi:hypothetical protein MRB53_028596 [Persea americana]|uniref:Uncharacterized protein n=1 Tax=Persea americana TaxID=3435 RepID=A0ACC2KG00_PERAE|nr:hypothetical protein MRB53_028596 [Persea americana]
MEEGESVELQVGGTEEGNGRERKMGSRWRSGKKEQGRQCSVYIGGCRGETEREMESVELQGRDREGDGEC